MLLLGTGCGGEKIYPVDGKIVDEQGAPVTELRGGTVEFEAQESKLSATGSIDNEGRFVMTTHKKGDGALLGKHRVIIMQPAGDIDRPLPRIIARKYESFDSSGLAATVEAKKNQLEFKVERAKSRN